jgi:hypothetical protein
LFRLVINAKEQFQLTTQSHIGYLFVKGELKIGNDTFIEGDGLCAEPWNMLALAATSSVEALWFEL